MPAWGSHGGGHRSWVEGGRGGGFEEHCEHQDPEDWEAPLHPDRRCYQIPQEWVD